MADVFISYHETSAGTLAQQIADTLEQAGISCWLARRDMPFGGDFSTGIAPQIDACKLFLFLMNEEACQSEHVHNECGFAFERYNKWKDILLLPLNIGSVQWKNDDWARYYFFHIQCVSFSAQPDMQELNLLANRVVQLLNSELKQDLRLLHRRALQKGQLTSLQKLFFRKPEQQIKTDTLPKIIDGGDCGDDVIYTLYENGQLVIVGSGPMQDYRHANDIPWFPQRKKISNIHIQKGVTSIGDNSFTHCENLTRFSIPDSVTSIGEGAFFVCKSLTSILIPDSVTSIGDLAFSETGLTSIRIPDSVTCVRWYTFHNCKSLKNVDIPNSVTDIGVCAFSKCRRLKSVSIPAETKIHSFAFDEHTTVTRRPKKP